MRYWNYIKYFIVWLIGLIAFFIIAFAYLEIIATFELVLFGMGYALFTTLFFMGIKKQRLRAPSVIFFIGLNLLFIGGGFLLGGLVLDNIDKSEWWYVPDIAKKTILGVIAFAGFLMMAVTARETLRNWWWLSFRRRG